MFQKNRWEDNALPGDSSQLVSSFLSKLNMWQKMNLYTVLQQAESDISFAEARTNAVALDDGKLKYMLTEAINSPRPRNDYHNLSNSFTLLSNRKKDYPPID